MFENRVKRGGFGPKRDEVIGQLPRLNKEGFMIFTSHQISRDPVKNNEMDGACSTFGEV
jgi:hypothetical protein